MIDSPPVGITGSAGILATRSSSLAGTGVLWAERGVAGGESASMSIIAKGEEVDGSGTASFSR